MKGSKGKSRAGAVRKKSRGGQVGSGGQGRQALEGRGPTPKAEDRPYHPAGKKKASKDRYEAAVARTGSPASGRGSGPASGPAARGPQRPKRGAGRESEFVAGRNSVLEALRTRVPASTLYLAHRIEFDDRVKDIVGIATQRGIPVLEVMRAELDRLAGPDTVHQGVGIVVPAYEYAHPVDLVERTRGRGGVPLLVALDGVTDPRNLGAIIRSVAAFGGQGVIVPQRRSVGLTAAAWKTSAGAAARIPVAMAANLTATVKELKASGLFVIGLDGGGDVALPSLQLATEPLLVVVGSEGKGLSRLVREQCDAIVSIPISAATESLNAGIAASVALYQIATLRSAAGGV
ncbi:MAG: 23S rRNA (guanosine(2251)-2'-O)-methyltransferase RlmB [Microbacteriaceae bacterium]